MSPAARRILHGVAGASAIVAAITVAARIAGFARQLVFSHAVGATAAGTAYTTANQLPNTLFEVAAGGALAGVVVPLLSGAVARGLDAERDRVASALLSWTVLVLLPLSAALAAFAGPLTGVLLGGAGIPPGTAALATRLLVVFAPQVPLYGICIVLSGVLQAHRRFVWPALVPLVSSLVVMASYAVVGVLADSHELTAPALGPGAEAWLGWGTTAGVMALSLPLFWPVRRTGTRLRPTLRFPPGVARRALRLAAAGIGVVACQQLTVFVTLALANTVGGVGVWNVFQYVQAVYLLPYAVLVVPLATVTFPRLAAAVVDGTPTEDFAPLAARSTRRVSAAALLGAALLLAVAAPVGAFFGALDAGAGHGPFGAMAWALAAMAPGVWGWGLVAQLSRTLYALDRGRAAAVGTATGWLVAVAATLVMALAVAGRADAPGLVLFALAVGNTLGMGVAGVLLLVAVRRTAGRAATAGTVRVTAIGLGVAAVAGAAGAWCGTAVLGWARPATGPLWSAALAAVAAAAAALLVAGALGAPALRRVLRPGPRRTGPTAGRPLRVVMVVGPSTGGIVGHVAALVSGLRDRGVEVAVATAAVTAGRAALGDVHVIWPASARGVPGAVRRLRALVRGADVVHAQGHQAGLLSLLALAGLRDRPRLVVSWHNAVLGTGFRRRLQAGLERLQARGADLVTGASTDLVDRARALGARAPELAPVAAPEAGAWHGDRDAARAGLAREAGLDPARRWVLTVSRIAPQKNLDVLLDAAARLAGRDDLTWLVAGSGDEHLTAALGARIAAEHLPVRLLGARGDVPRLMAVADAFALASRWEARALVVQEALAAGLPVVATAVGGLPGLLDGAGLLVPVGDPAALARDVARVLDDPGLAARLAEAGRRRFAGLPDEEAVLRDWLDRYSALAGRPGSRPQDTPR